MINKMCLNSFKKLDIFGSEITLNYNKESLFRTPFGGIVAIICILTLALLFFNNILTLIGKTQVTAVSSIIYNPNPDVFEVGYNKMMIAVKFDQDNFIQRPKMNITFEKRHYIKYDNGTYDQQKVPVPLEPCTVEHFQDLPNYNINWDDKFQLSGIDDYLCLQKGQNFKIGGTYENKDFYHIKFILKQCQNQTNPVESWKPVCDTPENINKTTEDVRIKFLLSNTLLNPESTQASIQTFVDTLVFNVQPQKMYTTANIMLNEQKVRTDESVTLFKDIQETTFVSFKQGEFKQQFSVGNFTKYSEIFFLRSNFSTTVKRTFLKIDQVISYMGGFCQIFLLVSAIIVSQFNEYVYNIELANKLYDFDIQDKSKNPYKPLAKNNTSSSFRLCVKQNISSNTPAKFLTEGDCTSKNNQIQNLRFNQMQDSPHKLKGRNSLQQKNEIQDQNNDNKNTNYLTKKTILKEENENREQQFYFQQNQTKQESQTILNLHKEEDNYSTQRLDSIRPICFQTNNSKVIQYSKFSSQREIPLINLDKNGSSQVNYAQQLKNCQHQLDHQLYDQDQHQEIDIEKINIEVNKQQPYQIRLEKPSSKYNLNTISSVQRGSLFDVQSDGIINTKFDEQEQHFTQVYGHSQNIKMKQEKVSNDNKQFLEQELKYIVQRDRSLWLNIKYFINKITCGKFYNTNEVILLNKAIEMVKQDLDIFNILDRQKEIEKFKKLFLTPDQQVLFNFFPKPLIKANKDEVILTRYSLKKDDKQKSIDLTKLKRNQTKKLNLNIKNLAVLSKAVMKFKQNLSGQKISDYQALFNCYEKIMQQNSSEVEKIVNKKLIEQLGNEMKTIFEVAYMMKNKSHEKDQICSFNRTIQQVAPSQHNIFNPSIFKNINIQQQNASSVNESIPESSDCQQHQDLNQIYKENNVPNACETSIDKEKQNQQEFQKNQEDKKNIEEEVVEENMDNLILFEQVEHDPNQDNESHSTEKEIENKKSNQQ
ncbi:transmembrane protein, putative (macronuclear) [Tetrahymena thermophila SB210]|uniref:Transmembrane protein, putative n=1 Tax=Tetrahymena thermophila (strain SB210) TaxID=312017 RepID=Q22SG7_TETTS|nr:transmembrane protein, putative [Tetrahymena thermophila SB210]EAR87805.2 transmembrane protein, putative [Tetrahymena thermophila SB210]|eukprot:XP_001008050.2 transmembrane protein, putative [Tetrahymena thermophila SB210]